MKRASAPSYDLFKLAVTIVLLVILLLMLLRGCASISAAPSPPTENPLVTEPAASNTSLPVPTETEGASAPNTPESPEPSSAPTAMEPTTTPTTAATVTPAAEVAIATTEPAAVTPESTAAETTATAVTPADGTGDNASCNTSVSSRLSAGQTAQVVQRLNMRSQPSITAPILQTNPTNTQVEIISGPVCTPVGDRAYIWWQIRLANGAEGWSAESQLNEASYLLEPIP